ncbi:MAG: MFS transporter [archaeon]
MGISNLGKVNILIFLTKLITGAVNFFLPLYLFAIKLSGIEIGTLIGTYAIAGLFISLPTGIANDRLSTKQSLILGLIAMGISLFGMAFFREFLLLLPCFLIGGFGYNISSVSLQSIVLKGEHKKNEEGKKLGKFNLFLYLGSATGFLLGGITLTFINFQSFFQAAGILLFCIAILALFLNDSKTSQIHVEEYKKDFMTKKVLLFLIPLLLFTFHWGAETTSYALFLKQAFSLDTGMMGIYMSIPVICLAIVSYFGGKWIDKKGAYKKMFLFAILISGIGHILMIYPNLYVSFFFRVMHEIGDGLAMIAIIFWTAKLFEKEKIGGHSSAITTLSLCAQFLGSVIFGPVGESFGYGIPLAISGALILIAIPFVMLSKK